MWIDGLSVLCFNHQRYSEMAERIDPEQFVSSGLSPTGHILFILGSTELDDTFQMESHQIGAERENSLTWPDVPGAFDASQDTAGAFWAARACGWVMLSSPTNQVLFPRAVIKPFSAQPLFALGCSDSDVEPGTWSYSTL